MSETTNAQAPRLASAPRVVTFVVFFSSFDRWAMGPTLVLVAAGLGVDIAVVASIAGAYFLSYGFCQPVWGVLSDRIGRVRLMRWLLVVGALAGLATAFAPGVAVLAVARVVAGVCWGGIVPTCVAYVGDSVEERHRQNALSRLTGMLAFGTAFAMLVGGIVGAAVSWRVVLGLPAVAGIVAAVAMYRLPEPHRDPVVGGMLSTVRGVLAYKWAWFVFAVAFIEGAVILGLLTFLPAALTSVGVGEGLAGAVVALYGVSVFVCSRLVGRASARYSLTTLIALGGAVMVVGLAIGAVHISIPTVAVCAILFGAGWVFFHSSLQVWTTTLVPWARGTVVSMFSASLFIGSAIFTSSMSPLVSAGMFQWIFAACGVSAVALTIAAAVGYSRYSSRSH